MATSIVHVLLWTLVLVQGVAITILVRQLADLRMEIRSTSQPAASALRRGVTAPDFDALDLTTRQVVTSDRWRGQPMTLLFVSPGCGACVHLLAELAISRERLGHLVIYCSADSGQCESHLASIGTKAAVLAKANVDVSYLYRVGTYPVAVSIDEHWTVLDVWHPVNAADAIGMRERQDAAIHGLTPA